MGRVAGARSRNLGRRRHGTTLLETLVTLILLAVVLGIIGGVSGECASVVRFSAGKDPAAVGVRSALEEVREELGGAVAVVEPAAGETSFELQFTRVDPTVTARLPATPYPTPVPSPSPTWNPFDPSYMVTVRYYVQAATLWREVTPAGDGTPRVEAVASAIAGFSATALGPATYQLSASFQEATRIQTLTTTVQPWIGQ